MKLIFIGFIILFLFYSAQANSFIQNSDKLKQMIDYVIEQKYEESFQIAIQFEKQSYKLEAWTSRAIIYHALMIDYESYEQANFFFQACDSAMYYAHTFEKNLANQAYALFAKGLIEGLKSNILRRQGDFLKAITSALNMKKYLTECIQLDPNLIDAYVGLGNFDYWSSKALTYLPFLIDHRERGIARLIEAEKKSLLHPVIASTALIWIYMDKKEYSIALKRAEELLVKYPNARSLMWAAGESSYQMKNWEKGIYYYEMILQSVKSSAGQKNHYNELGCYHRLIEMYRMINNKEKAKLYIKLAKSLKLSDEVKERKKKDISDIEKWEKELK
ncbi:MAG: hypothetical protein N2450_02570 [bacterium]|nr:hypothetical protein [bacterium]